MTTRELLENMLKDKCDVRVVENDTKRKDHKPMDFANAKLVVGNRVYPTKYVNFESTPGDYPVIEATAILNPCGSVPYYATPKPLSITNVIFNPPATIVFWSDNTKTVVKARGEFYDPEKGIAIAISKKLLGDNKYEYYYQFEHWLKKWNKQCKDNELRDFLTEALNDAFDEYHDKNFDKIHKGVPRV